MLKTVEQGISNYHVMYEKFLIEGGLMFFISDRFSCITLNTDRETLKEKFASALLLI